jgi:hypothetical protein
MVFHKYISKVDLITLEYVLKTGYEKMIFTQ